MKIYLWEDIDKLQKHINDDYIENSNGGTLKTTYIIDNNKIKDLRIIANKIRIYVDLLIDLDKIFDESDITDIIGELTEDHMKYLIGNEESKKYFRGLIETKLDNFDKVFMKSNVYTIISTNQAMLNDINDRCKLIYIHLHKDEDKNKYESKQPLIINENNKISYNNDFFKSIKKKLLENIENISGKFIVNEKNKKDYEQQYEKEKDEEKKKINEQQYKENKSEQYKYLQVIFTFINGINKIYNDDMLSRALSMNTVIERDRQIDNSSGFLYFYLNKTKNMNLKKEISKQNDFNKNATNTKIILSNDGYYLVVCPLHIEYYTTAGDISEIYLKKDESIYNTSNIWHFPNEVYTNTNLYYDKYIIDDKNKTQISSAENKALFFKYNIFIKQEKDNKYIEKMKYKLIDDVPIYYYPVAISNFYTKTKGNNDKTSTIIFYLVYIMTKYDMEECHNNNIRYIGDISSKEYQQDNSNGFQGFYINNGGLVSINYDDSIKQNSKIKNDYITNKKHFFNNNKLLYGSDIDYEKYNENDKKNAIKISIEYGLIIKKCINLGEDSWVIFNDTQQKYRYSKVSSTNNTGDDIEAKRKIQKINEDGSVNQGTTWLFWSDFYIHLFKKESGKYNKITDVTTLGDRKDETGTAKPNHMLSDTEYASYLTNESLKIRFGDHVFHPICVSKYYAALEDYDNGGNLIQGFDSYTNTDIKEMKYLFYQVPINILKKMYDRNTYMSFFKYDSQANIQEFFDNNKSTATTTTGGNKKYNNYEYNYECNNRYDNIFEKFQIIFIIAILLCFIYLYYIDNYYNKKQRINIIDKFIDSISLINKK